MNKRIPTFQWVQLLALSAVHFTADMFGNMLPSILPAVRSEFALSLSIGGFVLAALVVTANGVQMATGHLRPEKTTPFFLHIGLTTAACVCLVAVLPRSPLGVWFLMALAAISGCGIAVVHPEGLRAIHTITHIPASITTAVFMAGGFLGFASGGIISTALVARFGLPGLYPLLLCPLVGIVLVIALRIRLAAEPVADQPLIEPAPPRQMRFHLIVLMGLPAALSTTVVALLLPTRLEELGFELTFGGYSATMFGLGGVLGAFIWASIAHRKGELLCSTVAFLLAGPAALAYLLLMANTWAVWIVFSAGFFAFAAYMLLITLARYAAGAGLGSRMGWIVGGTWLFANILFLPLVPVADHFGTDRVLYYAPVGYILSGLFGVYVISKNRAPAAPNRP